MIKNFIISIFICISILNLTNHVFASEKYATIPISEFSIGGISFKSTLADVIQIYGEPTYKTYKEESSRNFVLYNYNNKFIVGAFNFGHSWAKSDLGVYKVILRNANNLFTPSGITVGQDFSEVTKKFGYTSKINYTGIKLPNCSYYCYHYYEANMIFAVDYENIIREIIFIGVTC